jgi:hypothetical protein
VEIHHGANLEAEDMATIKTSTKAKEKEIFHRYNRHLYLLYLDVQCHGRATCL